MKSLSSLKYSTRYPPLSPLDYVPFILSNFFYRIFVSKWNEFRNPRKKIQKKGKRKGAEQTLSRNTGASSRLLACHTASLPVLFRREFSREYVSLQRKLLTLTDCDYVKTRHEITLVDATFLLSTMRKRGGGRPRGVVHKHMTLSKSYTDDQQVCFTFTCKYCGKVKQTCKPGAPAKIPVAPGPLRPTPVSTLLWKLPIKNLISPKMLANSSNFPQKSI